MFVMCRLVYNSVQSSCVWKWTMNCCFQFFFVDAYISLFFLQFCLTSTQLHFWALIEILNKNNKKLIKNVAHDRKMISPCWSMYAVTNIHICSIHMTRIEMIFSSVMCGIRLLCVKFLDFHSEYLVSNHFD